jgi:hypothetical protein
MFALNRLKEQSLRRLYKFILKRVIGQYLESELVLEVSENLNTVFFIFIRAINQIISILLDQYDDQSISNCAHIFFRCMYNMLYTL